MLLALHILFLVLYLLLEHMYTAGPGKTRLVSDMSAKLNFVVEQYFLLSYIRYITSFHWEDLIFWNLLKNPRSVFPVLCTHHVDVEELIQGK